MSVLSEIDGFAPDRIEISNKDSNSHSMATLAAVSLA